MIRPLSLVLASSAVLTSSLAASEPSEPSACEVELVVLGAGQDAGAPQIGNALDNGPRLLPSSVAVIDRTASARYLFDVSPAITDQLAMLDAIEPPAEGLGIDGAFLTHAHMGHYLGLAYFGREAAGASGIPVYAMPRMMQFLQTNGPWDQLVDLGNIDLRALSAGAFTTLSDDFGVLPIPVPHRDEYSETVGFVLMTPELRALYLPDLDSWEEFEEASGVSLRAMVGRVDYAFVDATFWDDNELVDENGRGRDMSEIPHPRVSVTMDLLQDLPAIERAKVHFIHYNHTNPIRDPGSAESREVLERGFNIARSRDRHCLSGAG